MKTVVTLCFTLAFLQVVVGKVQYGRRTIRQSQSFETADTGQLQQPPVETQASAISPDSASLPDTNVVTSAQNLVQPNASTNSSPSALELNELVNPPTTSSTSPPVCVATTSNPPRQIPPPNQFPSPTTPFNPARPPNGTPANFFPSSNIPAQIPSPLYPYNPAMFPGTPSVYPGSPYANPMAQQFMYNPYYTQNPMAYMNPQQMMYGMPPNPMQYMPFFPPSAIPQAMMNYNRTFNNNFTNSPQQFFNTSPYPFPQNYIPAPSAPEESTNPTVISSNGETGSDLNSLPPQVKEFIDMIPQILSMHESTPGPSTNAIKRPPFRKFPKLPPPTSLLKKKQYYQSNYAPSASPYSNYPQRYGYYY